MAVPDNITNAEIRMYRLGTGDCFAIRFRRGNKIQFKMLIDAGMIHPNKDHIPPFIEDLHGWMGGTIDLMIVTHEHLDHVSAIKNRNDIFFKKEDWTIHKIWLAWTENNDDSQAKEWKDDHGKKKQALAFAYKKFHDYLNSNQFELDNKEDLYLEGGKKSAKGFTEMLKGFGSLHGVNEEGNEILIDSELPGMKHLKKELASGNIEYKEPGNIIELEEAPGLKFYVLGPPRSFDHIKKEKGKGEEAYQHNDQLDQDDFISFAMKEDEEIHTSELPFFRDYLDEYTEEGKISPRERYFEDEPWRKIDYDWLSSSGRLAMRLNSGINNLSLVLAIEFTKTGNFMLFPGDAEIGSWQSWQNIDWDDDNLPNDYAKEILKKTKFYKVAHHLSHNGTAKEDGLRLMTHPELSAMATVSYEKIHDGWKKTMPNKAILKELLEKTKGRLIVMDVNGIKSDPKETKDIINALKEARKHLKSNDPFFKDFNNIGNENALLGPEQQLYFEYVVKD